MTETIQKSKVPTGIKYCRSCYTHLAGYVGVRVTEAMENRGLISKNEDGYAVSASGWQWFGELGIHEEDFHKKYRPLTKQCLDFSERKPHLAGLLGADFLKRMLEREWITRVPGGRELRLTKQGKLELEKRLGLKF